MPSKMPITNNPRDIEDMQNCLVLICTLAEGVVPDLDRVADMQLTPPQLVDLALIRVGLLIKRGNR